MENKTKQMELKSPKVQSLIGKIPRRLVISAVIIYTLVFLLILVVVRVLNIDGAGTFVNRFLGI